MPTFELNKLHEAQGNEEEYEVIEEEGLEED